MADSTVPKEKLSKSLLIGILYGIAGFALNYLKLELFFNVDFIFGSIITVFALLRFGAVAGVTAAFIASLCTILHWHQPWAVLTFTAEALFVSLTYRRYKIGSVLADLIYWVTAGALLVLFAYGYVMHFTPTSTVLILCKQGVNGVFNTLIAAAIFISFMMHSKKSEQLPTLKQLIFATIAMFVTLPAFIFLYVDIRANLANELHEHSHQIKRAAETSRNAVYYWNNDKLSKKLSLTPDETLYHLLKSGGREEEVFLSVVDADGIIIETTKSSSKRGDRYSFGKDGFFTEVDNGVKHWIPKNRHGIGAAKRWKASYFFIEIPLGDGTGWKIVAEAPLNKTLEEIDKHTSLLLVGIAALLVVIIFLSRYFAKKIAKLISDFTTATKSIPQKIAATEEIVLPKPLTEEMVGLNENIKEMAAEIRDGQSRLEKANITLEKRVHERTKELITSRDQWERTFNSIPDIITILDLEHRIIHSNKAMVDAMDSCRDGCKLGEPCYKVVHNLDAPPQYCPHSLLIKDGMEHSEEVYEPLLGKHLMVTVTPFYDSDGKLTGSIHVARDITERKMWEESLIVAKSEAEKAAVAKSQFLATMSHEIRTPMNGILGMSNLLSATNLDSDQKEMLQTITESGRSLLNIINDILDFSKIEAGKVELHLEPLSLSALLSSVIASLSPLSTEKGITLSKHISSKLPELITADPLRLKQILLNLVGNAIKFTEKGGVTIDLQKELRDNRSFLKFEVIDTGIGIEDSQIDHIFELFRQADGSTTRKYGGTGLGLAICRKLVEQMGGMISVTSAVGVGSRFAFTIALDSAEKQDEPPEVESFENDESEAAETVLNILMAEDDHTNQKVAAAFIKKLQHKLDIVENGEAAVAALQIRDYDLVLMDCMMPKMGGFEATAIIRNLESKVKNHNIPIIALTANAIEGDREKCIAAGMNDYLAKPFDIEELQSICKKWGIK